ncbi:MAG: tetratricopeptide repeat protein [Proteobacteria bacterium]|nr:tetratricopeptide repeat protein [Pseudomonadota bacterium]
MNVKHDSRPTTATLLALLLLLLPVHTAGALSQQTATDPDLTLAELTLTNGDCRAAAEKFQKLAVRRREAAVAERAAAVGAQCSHLDAELKSARRWQALDPKSPDAARARALAAIKLGRTGEARDALGEFHQMVTDRGVIEAIPVASEAVGAWPLFAALTPVFDSPKARYDLLIAASDLALDAFDFAAAERYADRALDEDPASGEARARLATTHAMRGESIDAIALAREAVALAPDDRRFAVVDTLVRLDRLAEARQELTSMQADGIAAVEAELRLARLDFQAGDLDAAQRRFGALLQAKDAAPEAFYFLSMIAERQKKFDVALEGYQRLISAGAGVMVRSRAARLLLKRGDQNDAFALLDAVVTADPSAGLEVELIKASLLDEQKQGEASLAILDSASERFANHPSVRYQRALALDKLGQYRDSFKLLEVLLKDRPDDPTIMNAYGYSLADRNQQLPRAEQLIVKALAAAPDNPAVLDSLAWVRFRHGDAASALPLLERAYRVFPDAEIAAHWGEVLWALERQAEARVIWARALARSPDAEILRATIVRLTGAEPVPPPTEAATTI